MPLISVIVPVYNVYDYLEDCLSSILESTFSDIEVIIVDDGSTDGSGEICDRFGETDSRCRVFHKQNGGLSDARNNGFNYATGQYVSFIDGDDYIHPQMYECLYSALKENPEASFSMCVGQQTFTKMSGSIFSTIAFPQLERTIIPKDTLVKNLVCRGTYDRTQIVVVWNKLYRYDAIKTLQFQESACEDFQFNCELFFNVESAVWINYPLYYWVQRRTSVTHQPLSPKKIDQVFIYEYCYDMVKEKYPQYASYFLNKLIKYFLSIRLRRQQSVYQVYAQEKLDNLRQKCLKEINTSKFPFIQKIVFIGLIVSPQLYKGFIQMCEIFVSFAQKLRNNR